MSSAFCCAKYHTNRLIECHTHVRYFMYNILYTTRSRVKNVSKKKIRLAVLKKLETAKPRHLPQPKKTYFPLAPQWPLGIHLGYCTFRESVLMLPGKKEGKAHTDITDYY